MIYGLYLSANGSLAQAARLNVTSNNLANTTTPGFKRDLMTMQQIKTQAERHKVSPFDLNPLMEKLGGTVMVDRTHTIHEMGRYKSTGNPLDVAIRDRRGFFAVEVNGKTRYTRDGAFRTAPDGTLTTLNGRGRVLNVDGEPITVQGENVHIDPYGDVIVDGESAGKINVADFQNYSELYKVGNNVFTDKDGRAGVINNVNIKLESGFIEGSAVNLMSEMASMIEASRSYEANMRMITSQDQTLGRLVSDVGRVTA